jgi:hypothetical protein
MNPTIRKIGRWGLRLFLAVCFIEALHISTLAFPYPLFRHKLQYDTLTMYSDRQLDSLMTAVLQDVSTRIAEIEIRGPEQRHRIFLCQSHKLYSFFAFLSRVSPASMGLNLTLFGNIFISRPRVDGMRERNIHDFTHSHLEGDLAQVIVHEIVHGCIKKQIGWWPQHSAPRWKQEGYCEYASTIAYARADSVFDFVWRVKKYMDGECASLPAHSRFYYRSHLLVEYLMETEGLTFAGLMDDRVTEQETLEKLRRWYGAKVDGL